MGMGREETTASSSPPSPSSPRSLNSGSGPRQPLIISTAAAISSALRVQYSEMIHSAQEQTRVERTAGKVSIKRSMMASCSLGLVCRAGGGGGGRAGLEGQEEVRWVSQKAAQEWVTSRST